MREQKKQKFISDFIKVFSQYGLDGTSMKKLSKEADMTESLIYRYFENKDDLIRQCVARYHPQIQHDMTQIMIRYLDQPEELPRQILVYIDSVIDICRFLMQVMAHPYYSSLTDATSSAIEGEIVSFADTLAEHTSISHENAVGISNLLNSIVNDYILKKSPEQFYRQYQIFSVFLIQD